MPKTMILYRSPHHGNTKKLLDAIRRAYPDVALYKAGEEAFDASAFDTVGIASGVYHGMPHQSVCQALGGIAGNGRRAFAVYTCGARQGGKYGERFMALLRDRGFDPCGFYFCVGHDSFGPFRMIGGINKNRPDEDEIAGAAAFYKDTVIGADEEGGNPAQGRRFD